MRLVTLALSISGGYSPTPKTYLSWYVSVAPSKESLDNFNKTKGLKASPEKFVKNTSTQYVRGVMW